MNRRGLLTSLVLLALATGASCKKDEEPPPTPPDAQLSVGRHDEPPIFRSFRHEVMATTIEVLLPDSAEVNAQAGMVFSTFDEVDARMSEWKPGSPLSRVNTEAGHAVDVPARPGHPRRERHLRWRGRLPLRDRAHPHPRRRPGPTQP